MSEGYESTTRFLTVPNAVTMLRLALLPVFVWLVVGPEERFVAGWLLVGIGATDWVDGYLARRLGQVSDVGKVLDPVADRLLFFVGAGTILADGSVPVWFAWAVIGRELAVSVAVLVLAALGARRIDVTWVGKSATFLLMGAFPAFLIRESGVSGAEIYGVVAWAVGVPGLVLSYWSAAAYVPLGRRALAQGRADRVAQTGTATRRG